MHSVPRVWRDWLILNQSRGCNRDVMIERAMAHGFDRAALEEILDANASAQSPELFLDAPVSSASGGKSLSPLSWLEWFQAALTNPGHAPRAWKLDTHLAQVYEIPDLLTSDECEQVIEKINQALQPSTVTRGSSDYRTSRTCHLRQNHPQLAASLDQRFAALFGVDPRLSEPIQGQRYDPGEYFKEHTDWFAPGTEEYATHTDSGGQRTWTVMVYLNAVERGGETLFRRLGRSFTPVPGMALAWNNLQADGTPNPFTLHEALPVQAGHKWVITKWFRADFGRNG